MLTGKYYSLRLYAKYETAGPFNFDRRTIGLRQIEGDDDFVVLFGPRGWIVWSFKKEALPLAGSLFDETLEVPPADRPHPLRN